MNPRENTKQSLVHAKQPPSAPIHFRIGTNLNVNFIPLFATCVCMSAGARTHSHAPAARAVRKYYMRMVASAAIYIASS
jgi:hypothetical protein